MIELANANIKHQSNYLEAFRAFERGAWAKQPVWLKETRREAIAKFSELGFPTTKQEHWRYTNVSELAATPFRFSFEPAARQIDPKKIAPPASGGSARQAIVFVNGFYSPALSTLADASNKIHISSLKEEAQSGLKTAQGVLAKHASIDRNVFTALNTAFLHDGALIRLPKGHQASEPIHLIFVTASPRENIIVQPRNLIVAEAGSRAAVIEHYISLEEDLYFTNAVTEIVLEENASLDHYKLQQESRSAFHIAATEVYQKQSSAYSASFISSGARLAREDIHIGLDAEGAECELNGLYLGAGGQHLDQHVSIDHWKPRGTSRQLFKGLLDDKATGVFFGKIFVHKGAQKTDAHQTNKNLLLSNEATADTKPQLEILADDVQCTHGAAVGQLDEQAVFYLKSRGIGEREARRLMSYGFAGEVLARIHIEPLRKVLEDELLLWLDGGRNGT